jgi:hypothetical protein
MGVASHRLYFREMEGPGCWTQPADRVQQFAVGRGRFPGYCNVLVALSRNLWEQREVIGNKTGKKSWTNLRAKFHVSRMGPAKAQEDHRRITKRNSGCKKDSGRATVESPCVLLQSRKARKKAESWIPGTTEICSHNHFYRCRFSHLVIIYGNQTRRPRKTRVRR